MVPQFHETFVDRDNSDEYDAMLALSDAGFEGAGFPEQVLEIKNVAQRGHPRQRL